MDTFEYFLFQGNLKPHFDERNKCFELDSCLGFAKVCLVYKDIASGIITRSDRLISIIFRRFVKPRVSRVILQMCFFASFFAVGVTDSTPEIWLLDRSLRWTYLASSFQNYFRMLIVHLGLPLWQYRFTQAGLSPETKVLLQGLLTVQKL